MRWDEKKDEKKDEQKDEKKDEKKENKLLNIFFILLGVGSKLLRIKFLI